MIIEALLNVIKFIIRGIIAIFPTIPAIEFGDLTGLFRVLSTIDLVVNIKIVGVCLGVLLAFNSIELIWGVIMWVVRKLPFMN